MKVIIVSNQVPPLKNGFTSGPGLRAYSLYQMLIEIFDVKILSPMQTLVSIDGFTQPDLGSEHFLLINMRNLCEHVIKNKPDFIILTNYIQFHWLEKELNKIKEHTKIIYDFFAPKILEMQNSSNDLKDVSQHLIRKKKALEHSDFIILNGEQKINYYLGFCTANNIEIKPLVNIPFFLSEFNGKSASIVNMESESKKSNKKMTITISGDMQPWTSNKLDYYSILNLVPDDLVHFNVYGKSELQKENLTVFTRTDFFEFLEGIKASDISLDLFEYTHERKLAWVTRTAISISCGVPPIHPRYTEIGEIIHAHDLGWTYENEGEIIFIIQNLINRPKEVEIKKNNISKYLNKNANKKIFLKRFLNMLQENIDQIYWYSDKNWIQTKYFSPNIGNKLDKFDDVTLSQNRNCEENWIFGSLQQSLTNAQKVEKLKILFDSVYFKNKYNFKVANFEFLFKEYIKAPYKYSPNTWFSEKWYVSQNEDVARAIKDGIFQCGFHHYLTLGARLGLSPNYFYNEQYYLELNQDVKSAVALGSDNMPSGSYHFCWHGFN